MLTKFNTLKNVNLRDYGKRDIEFWLNLDW